MYQAPYVEHDGPESVRRARADGILALGIDECEAQAIELRDGRRSALPGVQVARYDVREFVY